MRCQIAILPHCAKAVESKASITASSSTALCRFRHRAVFDPFYRVLSIEPRPGRHFTHAVLSYDSIYGTVESKWERRDGKTVHTITIPANCTAEIELHSGTGKTVGAGVHIFEEETT